MAGEVLSFGIQKLWDRLSQEYALFHGVDDQVAELKSDLNLLNSFLKDADAKKHTSAMVRNCVLEIKEIVCDAEDIIETFLLKEKFGKTSGVKKHIRRLACVIPDRREIALDIGGLSKRISKMISVMQSFGIRQLIDDGGYMQLLHDRQRQMRQEFARENESDLVGVKANVERLVKYLVEEDNVQVVSITGMGGLGKTTLARQAFNHEMVENKFDRLAWVSVSQIFTQRNVWQTILQSFRPKEEQMKITDMDERTLQDKLLQLLRTSKSLIVFDDIWKEKDWDVIKPIFPSEKGWKVLLTSRNENVARRRDTSFINFKPDCLTNEESWTLFQRIAMPREAASDKHAGIFFSILTTIRCVWDYQEVESEKTEERIEMEKTEERIEMEKMGKQMIEHCKGLPLAIRVLGGLLVAKYTLRDWKRVSEDIGSHLVGRNDFNDHNNNSLYNVLSLSFEELPSLLKYCFLYLVHFPEDHEIDVENLSYLWAAEGILRYNDGETIRDAGDTYIEELVRRNMVISKRDITTERFETCQLHDLMREICLSKAKEENFVQLVGIHSQTAHSQSLSTSRRFVSQNPTTLHVEREINNSKVRSLVVVQKYLYGGIWLLSGLSFSRLQLLRVLHLRKAAFKGLKLPYGIGKLIHLRYLSLEKALVRHLPYSLRNLKLLIYLNLNLQSSGGIFVPNVLMGMKELRYLSLPFLMHKKTKLELSNLKKLETLKNFNTQNCSLEDLRGMARLRTLKIELIGEKSLEKLSASIGGMIHLENLDIDGDEFAMKKIEKGFVLDAVNLRQLKLKGIYMPKFPDERRFPSHLTTISLAECRLEEDPMPILEKLLQLKEVYLWEGSFCGRRMVFSAGGFPQLQKLAIEKLDELEEWIVEEGSMPLLHTLWIGYCPKLKEVPDGLRFLNSLKELQLWYLDELEEWIVEEGSMPLLHTLWIGYCPKLKEVPDGLRFLNSLKELQLWYLDELEEWIVEEGSMPLLHTLWIGYCPKLKEVPDGLRFLNSLKDLQLYGLDELEEWIVEEGSMPLLHTLWICNCPKLKEVPDGLRFITSLKVLCLNGLDELEEWIVEEGSMPLLHTLYIGYCPKLKKLPDGLRFLTSLKVLALMFLHELEEWIVEEGYMPLLHTLQIGNCGKLKEVPDGLRFLTSLKNLTCRAMGEEWKERLSEGGEDYYKVQHIPSVKFSNSPVESDLKRISLSTWASAYQLNNKLSAFLCFVV